MIDRIKAFREPATLVAIGVVLVSIAVTSGRFATQLRDVPLAQVMRTTTGLYGLVDALVLTVLALSCVLVAPATRHASQLMLAASLLLWLGAAASLVFLVVSMVVDGRGPWSLALDALGGLADVAIRSVMAYSLVLAGRVAVSGVAPVAETPPPAPVVPTQEPPRRPTWQPDEATGVVWRSAADAASGAAAGTYESTGRGWEVPEDPDTGDDGSVPPSPWGSSGR